MSIENNASNKDRDVNGWWEGAREIVAVPAERII
jgi:hypothetical protein